MLVRLFNTGSDCLFEYSLFLKKNTITQSPPKNLSIVITQTSNTLPLAPLAPPCIHAGDLPRTPNPSRQQRKTALQPRTSFLRDPFPTSYPDQHHKHGPFTVPHPRLPRPHPDLHLLVSNLHPPRPFQTHLPQISRPRHRRKVLAQNQRLRGPETDGENAYPFRDGPAKALASIRQRVPVEE